MPLKTICLFVCAQLLIGVAGAATDSYSEIGTRDDLVLRVGVNDDMKTRNYLRLLDKWTMATLDPVYDTVAKFEKETEEPLPYIVLGVDADDSGVFDLDEYGTFEKESLPREVTAYYDLNDVYFHDGLQVTMDDLLFSYHLWALYPRHHELDVLKNLNNMPGTNYSLDRWLNVWPVEGVWGTGIPAGSNESLTFALHFSLQADFWAFTKTTLGGLKLVPRHLWEGTGKVCVDAQNGMCLSWREGIHDPFGYAYDPQTHNGVSMWNPGAFRFNLSEYWDLEDDFIVGTGPFTFVKWTPGVTVRLDKFEDYKGDALACEKEGEPPVCQGNFYSYMHQPYIDGILFKIYKSQNSLVFALQAGEIDYIALSVPPHMVPELVDDPNVTLEMAPSKGFGYLGYNMRKSPFGYPDNDPTKGDDGFWLRQAIAHIINKSYFQTNLLQNFGLIGDQPVSPAWLEWFNASVIKYDLDWYSAEQILDDHYTVGGWGLGHGPSGYRNLPTIGDGRFEILCPSASYDPILAQACSMIASGMRSVGLNASANLLAFGEVVEKLANRDVDMWVLESFIWTPPPDYYYSFFFSGMGRAGRNYAGFNNETLDDIMVRSRAEMNPSDQAELIKYASGVLARALPYDALFFRTNIEAYRHDRYINWTMGPASSLYQKSFWSWIGIHPPVQVQIELVFPNGTVVRENETLMFEVLVTDPFHGQVDGALVTLTCSPAGPDIHPDGGWTVNGSLGPISFEAPEVDSDTYFTVNASAEFWETVGYDEERVKVLDPDSEPPLPFESLMLLSIVIILIITLIIAVLLLKRKRPKEESEEENDL
ncbi:MAG: ABC transporter substrate-binding protein [Thermoplasmata archaeon]|nr:ABC transporter substrate-binding protein [Thermoplasmata archaeon]